jgi:hypothetical protein
MLSPWFEVGWSQKKKWFLPAPKNMLSQRSRFAKQFTKIDSAPLMKLFVELKQKKKALLVKWSPAKRGLAAGALIIHDDVFYGLIKIVLTVVLGQKLKT